MKAKELIKLLSDHPEAEISAYGFEYNRCGNEYGYYTGIEVEFDEMENVFYIVGYED